MVSWSHCSSSAWLRAALRGAKVEVHSIRSAEPPAAREDGEPGELVLGAPGSSITDDDDAAEVWDYKLVNREELITDEDFKHEGPKHLQRHLGVRPEANDLVRVTLPTPPN